ncbi:hypothetical protein A8C56_08805 [Niabella ginsenosidivorans]|uniref:Fructosamine kinase n=1 Tax=Niabella ginsenosidivorans TaxID=1176587 RepID=A0A1A9I154_9BACT|nr:fructosamine kinase family protein [Niabella ginsenosidivorans]ANH81065.1 hypothetical protein A8C56_08805 [Niabella ginsenosidivorans]
MSLSSVLNSIGLPHAGYESVAGGDINQAYRICSGETIYFLKINKAAPYSGLFRKEAIGLQELSANSDFVVPQPLKWGKTENVQYLLLEWIRQEPPQNNSWYLLGKLLAAMHRKEQPYFGFREDNYLGTWQQVNTPVSTWSRFYADFRILPLVKKLYDDQKLNKMDSIRAEKFCKALAALFPEEKPSLLHGDLWNGNLLFTSPGMPCVFDPAVYYGHREMDIGMTLLFGGFNEQFYQSYQQYYPLQPGWQQRLNFTQLYPLLLHAHLFGGHYIHTCRRILALF